MSSYPPTLIMRHRKENLKKCSLEPLKARGDLCFLTYPFTRFPSAPGYVMLALDAPLLSVQDRERGLFLIDATWRYAAKIERVLCAKKKWIKRSLPPVTTAYPRKQHDCADPERGLASVEALYVAYLLLGRDTSGLLDHYRWKEAFWAQSGLKNKLFDQLKGNFKKDKKGE